MEDEAYQPGKVHDLLMSLPWTDVFTTNYDTLLERAFKNGTGKISYKDNELLAVAAKYVIEQYKDVIKSNSIKDISNLINMSYP